MNNQEKQDLLAFVRSEVPDLGDISDEVIVSRGEIIRKIQEGDFEGIALEDLVEQKQSLSTFLMLGQYQGEDQRRDWLHALSSINDEISRRKVSSPN